MLVSACSSQLLHHAPARRLSDCTHVNQATHRVPIDAVAAGQDHRAWRSELASRLRTLAVLKLAGVTAFVWLFFIGYFYLLRNPGGPVTVMPLTALDRLIPFQPYALAAYVSLWLYVGIAPGLLRNWRELLVYGLWATALCGFGLALFYVWPTAVPSNSMNATIGVLQGVDAAGNACPSLHVATAMFSMVWIDHLLRVTRSPLPLRLLNAGWFAAIAYSTLAIKQHVVLDVVGGVLLGLAFAWLSLRGPRRRTSQ
jgi:membrane-associated phospholipid phosphatase